MGLLETTARRGLARCLGWHCLTWSEKFGIIFSIVTVSAVLLVVTMFCFGRARMSHRQRTTVRLPGGRRIARQHYEDTAPALFPIAQQWPPGFPGQVTYYPATFSLGGPGGPRAQPYAAHIVQPCPVPWPCPPARPAIVYGAVPAQPVAGSFGISAPEPAHVGSTETQNTPPRPGSQPPASPAESLGRPREPTWFQALSRLFRMPLGTASTVASSTRPGTPILPTSR